jgi:hypothetical protein
MLTERNTRYDYVDNIDNGESIDSEDNIDTKN